MKYIFEFFIYDLYSIFLPELLELLMLEPRYDHDELQAGIRDWFVRHNDCVTVNKRNS